LLDNIINPAQNSSHDRIKEYNRVHLGTLLLNGLIKMETGTLVLYFVNILSSSCIRNLNIWPQKTANNKRKVGLTYHSPSFFQKTYMAENGRDECTKDDKFWINFQTWKKTTYGARGPSPSEWDEILNEE
jgi:hypothetical protein